MGIASICTPTEYVIALLDCAGGGTLTNVSCEPVNVLDRCGRLVHNSIHWACFCRNEAPDFNRCEAEACARCDVASHVALE
eukprot:680630-Amphidinium_carterae.1